MQGILGAFHELDAALDAIEELKKKKFGDITVYTPTPRHEIDHALDRGPSPVRRFTLVFGLAGVTFGYWIAGWISDYWPIVVGNKPIASWVPYTILGFEVMVLVGGLATAFAMFGFARVPRFSHGDFGVWVETTAEHADDVMDVMRRHGAREVRSAR
jgi:hypothetical protein